VADLQKTIEIVFGAVNQTGDAFNSVAGGIDNLTDTISGVTGPLSDFADNLLMAESAVLLMGGALAGVAINQAGQFQDALNEIGTLFNATPEQVDYLSERVQAFAATSTSDITTINEALYNAISATGDWENAVNFLGEAEQLAVAGATDLNTAVDLLTTLMGAYGLETEEARGVSESMFVAVQNGKTTIDELAGAIGRVATSAAAGNVDIDTLGAAVAALTVSMGDTNESVTYLNSLLKELSKPGQELAAVMGDLSLETDGLVPIMARLNDAAGGSQEKMNALFGSTEAATAALILSKDASGKFADSLQAMAEKTGSVTAAYEVMADGFAAVNQRLANNVSLSLIALGTDIQSGYSDVVQGITDLFSNFTVAINGDALSDLTDYFNTKAAEFGTLFSEIAAALPEAFAGLDFSELTAAFDNLLGAVGDVVQAFFGDLDLTKPEELGEALQFLVDSFATLTDSVAAIIRSWETSAGVMGDTLRAVNDLDGGTIELGGTILGIAQQFETFKGLLELVSGALTLIGGSVAILAAPTALGALSTGFAAASTAVASLGTTAAAGGLVALAAPIAAAVAAAGGLAFGFNEMSAAIDDYNQRNALAEESTEGLADVQQRAAEALDSLNDRLGTNFGSMAEFNRAVEEGALVWDDTTNAWITAEQAQQQLNDSLLTGEQVQQQYLQALAEIDLAERDAAEAKARAKEEQQGYTVTYEDGVRTLTQFGAALSGNKTLFAETAKATKEAKEETDEFRLGMEKIASLERQKVFELKADIDIAKIQADADRVVAAFDSIGEAISSSNELVGSLVGSLDGLGRMDQLDVWDLIDAAEQRAQEAHEKQMELTDAEIERIKAQAKALEKSDALIKIDATGLEPELEAFMWRILDKIRVRMEASYSDYLLGSGCA